MHIAVTAVGSDRPGIVAAVTEALFTVGANLEDSRMAILGGHFALVLIADMPAGSDVAALDSALEPARASLGLTITVGPIADAPTHASDGEPWIVTVYGADRPGIVARVSKLLADSSVNISDLATHVLDGETPVYVMTIEVTLPTNARPGDIEVALRALTDELGVDLSMHPMEPETL